MSANSALFVGGVVGGVLGFAGYRIAGCRTGTCLLTSNPIISTLLGSILGVLVASSF